MKTIFRDTNKELEDGMTGAEMYDLVIRPGEYNLISYIKGEWVYPWEVFMPKRNRRMV